MKRQWISYLFIISLTIIFLPNSPAAMPEHEFIGAKKCGICHKKPEQGAQLAIWEKTKHAEAIETLKTPEAKEVGQKAGVTDPATDGKCLKCHSTSYSFTEQKVSDTIAVEEGVSCESCHGAGKDYMKKSVMENKQEAIAEGLVIPTEETCKKCHNEQSPTYKPFDFKESWDKIKHPLPKP